MDWEKYMEKAEQQIKTSQYLFKQGYISSSAFNAQQCVELSVKAVASLYGFEDFLKRHGNKKQPFNTHNPSQIFIETMYLLLDKYLPEQNKIKQKSSEIFYNNDVIDIVNESRLSISKIREDFNKMSQSNPSFQEMWLRSLGLSMKGFPITAYDIYNQYDDGLNDVDSMVLGAARDSMLEVETFCNKNRHPERFHYFKKEIVQMCVEDIGLSDTTGCDFVTALTAYGDSTKAIENCKQIIYEVVNEMGSVKVMDLLFVSNKFFTKYETRPNMKHLVTKINKQIDFLRVAYLLVLSPTVVLLYPHEIIGKYPTEIESLQKNSEDIYKEQKDRVGLLIGEAENIFKRMQIFCANGRILSIFD